jgi:hypothetical protein
MLSTSLVQTEEDVTFLNSPMTQRTAVPGFLNSGMDVVTGSYREVAP